MTEQYNQYLRFQLYGVFAEALDRTKEENEQFRGLYFRFDNWAGTFTLKVDRKDYENAPEVGSSLWLGGVLRTSSSQRINPQVLEYVPCDSPPPLEEQQLGGLVSGPAGLFRQTYVVDGESRYNCRVTSFGFFRVITINEELYRTLPQVPNAIHMIKGRLFPVRDYNKEYGFRTAYDLGLDTIAPYESQRVRRPARPERPERTE